MFANYQVEYVEVRRQMQQLVRHVRHLHKECFEQIPPTRVVTLIR